LDRTRRLLERGYFPSQLPPPFTTESFASWSSFLLTGWRIGAAQALVTKAELFSVARAGHLRRPTRLPNPVSQALHAENIATHWGAFVTLFRKSRLSASHPRFLARSRRAAHIASMQHLHERKVLGAAGYKVMLRADVSRFFPTIYTHSIPWALHGKTVAKRHRKPTAAYFGNAIDLSLRQGRDQQTMGIPIGPDTSHIIAESIATAVDLAFRGRLKRWPAGFRYVDDYFLFFNSVTDAEAALAALARSLQDFELQLNFEKTRISSTSDISEEYWTHRLRSFDIGATGKRQRSDLHHFFELAKELAKQNADENVMKYALQRTRSVLIRKENWDIFEAHMCSVALVYSNTLQTVAQILTTYKHHGFTLDVGRLSRLVNTVIQDAAPLAHHSEVAWCLWMCKSLALDLDALSVDAVAEIHSSVCLLILLDLEASGRLPKAVKQTYIRQFSTRDALNDDLWLLSYEAGRRHWGGMDETHIAAHPQFDELRVLDISFYDPGATARLLFDIKAGALAALQLESPAELFDREDASDYFVYEEEDDGYDSLVTADVFNAVDEPIEN
jgi:hypothetical protein